MGIRATFKEDLQSTPAEMMYGDTLRLPGEFLQEASQKSENSNDFIQKLRRVGTYSRN